MSLKIHAFPQEMIEAVVALPADQLLPGAYPDIADYFQSLKLSTPNFIEDTPVVVKLDDDQRSAFNCCLSKPTPGCISSTDSQSVSRFGALQLALGSSIGHLLSIPDVRSGTLVQDIYPKESSRSAVDSSYGSESEFAFHNDLSFLDDPEIPDFVTLGCIRNTEGVATTVVDSEDIFSRLDDKDVTELQKPQYVLRHTYHRGLATERVGQKLSAVILPRNEICLGVDMIPQTSEANIALSSLHKLLERIATPHILQPGEVLVLPNRRTVHARNTFTMAADADNRRWLQRVNIGMRTK